MKVYCLCYCLLLPLVCSSQNSIVTGETYNNFYTDIVDETISQGATWNGFSNVYFMKLDTFEDGGYDIIFECFYNEWVDTDSILHITKMTWLGDANFNIEYAVVDTASDVHVTPFPEGVTIPDDLALYNSWWEEDYGLDLRLGYFDSDYLNPYACVWDSGGIAYVAFRARTYFDQSDESIDTAYGWIRIESNVSIGDPIMTIYDYAISDIISGNYEIQKEEIQIYPNPTIDKVRVTGLRNETIYDVTDIVGKTLTHGLIKETPLEINMYEFPAGLYQLNIDGAFRGYILKSK